MSEQIEKLKELIDASNNVVFFGGAGVSTESGIPDFRSKDGLYNQHDVRFDRYQPEYLLSHSCLVREPKVYYEFHRQKMDTRNIEPNNAHKYLAALEKTGKLKAVVTQNIDGLHQKAGSKAVFEIHGTVALNTCTKCGKKFDGGYMIDAIDNGVPEWESKNHSSVLEKGGKKYHLPLCDKCGGLIKPDVVLYEEGLDDHTWFLSQKYISEADALIIAGTSLVVYPAAGLVNYYKGNKLILINLSETPYDDEADLVLHRKLGEVFEGLSEKVR